MNASTPSAHTSSRSLRPATRTPRILYLLLFFVLGLFAARLPVTLAAIGLGGGGSGNGPAEALSAITDAFRLIIRDHVEKPDPDALRTGAIRGMLDALDDPYAEYIPPKDRALFEKDMTGQFVGIGCQIDTESGWLTVVTPLEDSPALAAGIMAGDRIIKIEDKGTFGLSADECIALLTGEAGTVVNITVQRDGIDIPFTLTRARITSKAARGFARLGDAGGHWNFLIDPEKGVAYVRLTQFTPTAPEELNEALTAARNAAAKQGSSVKALILDLRGNPGGVLEAALDISDLFLGKERIMSVRGREGEGSEPETIFMGRRDGTPSEDPAALAVAVLIDQASASASEIVAGALQDRGRGVVIGTRTFGKGLVQSVRDLPHDHEAQVKFTTQRYYLPSGRLIQRTDDAKEWGVDPTPGFYIPMTEDEQVAMILKRRELDVIRGGGGGNVPAVTRWNDPDWVETVAMDKQLAAALRAVDQKVANGAWKAVGVDGADGPNASPTGRIAAAELKALERTRERLGREFARIDKRLAALANATDAGTASPANPPADLWPDTLDLKDGRITVTDKTGATVATLRITGRDVERWLTGADVVPQGAESPPPAPN